MNKSDKIENLLCRILEEICNSSLSSEPEDSEFGLLFVPEFKYSPIFEFTEEDIQLIKELEEENDYDFSTLTEYN